MGKRRSGKIATAMHRSELAEEVREETHILGDDILLE